MPKSVIHELEAVEIDEQQCQLTMPLGGILDCQLQPLDQKLSIRQSRQPVVMGHALRGNRQTRGAVESVHELPVADPQAVVVMQGIDQALFGNCQEKQGIGKPAQNVAQLCLFGRLRSRALMDVLKLTGLYTFMQFDAVEVVS